MLFRMAKPSVEKLSQLLGSQDIFIQKNRGGRPMVDITKQVDLMFFYCLITMHTT